MTTKLIRTIINMLVRSAKVMTIVHLHVSRALGMIFFVDRGALTSKKAKKKSKKEGPHLQAGVLHGSSHKTLLPFRHTKSF